MTIQVSYVSPSGTEYRDCACGDSVELSAFDSWERHLTLHSKPRRLVRKAPPVSWRDSDECRHGIRYGNSCERCDVQQLVARGQLAKQALVRLNKLRTRQYRAERMVEELRSRVSREEGFLGNLLGK